MIAATYPPGPDPMTTRSNCCSMLKIERFSRTFEIFLLPPPLVDDDEALRRRILRD